MTGSQIIAAVLALLTVGGVGCIVGIYWGVRLEQDDARTRDESRRPE